MSEGFIPGQWEAERRKSCAALVNLCVDHCTSTEVGFTLEQVHAMIDSHEASRGTK